MRLTTTFTMPSLRYRYWSRSRTIASFAQRESRPVYIIVASAVVVGKYRLGISTTQRTLLSMECYWNNLKLICDWHSICDIMVKSNDFGAIISEKANNKFSRKFTDALQSKLLWHYCSICKKNKEDDHMTVLRSDATDSPMPSTFSTISKYM